MPFLSTNCLDEGTIFSVSSLNVTTDAQSLAYLESNFFKGASPAEMQKLGEYYPSTPAAGSPFNTGSMYNLTSQYKRISAVQGDALFQAGRRTFLEIASKTQSTWSSRESFSYIQR